MRPYDGRGLRSATLTGTVDGEEGDEVIEDDEGADEEDEERSDDEELVDDILSGETADVSELYGIAGLEVDDDVDECGKAQASDGDSE